MKTLADVKKRIQLGVKMHAFNHWFNKDMGVREVGHIQTNSFAFKTDNGTLSWCEYPKASKLIIESENSFSIMGDETKCLTYTFV